VSAQSRITRSYNAARGTTLGLALGGPADRGSDMRAGVDQQVFACRFSTKLNRDFMPRGKIVYRGHPAAQRLLATSGVPPAITPHTARRWRGNRNRGHSGPLRGRLTILPECRSLIRPPGGLAANGVVARKHRFSPGFASQAIMLLSLCQSVFSTISSECRKPARSRRTGTPAKKKDAIAAAARTEGSGVNATLLSRKDTLMDVSRLGFCFFLGLVQIRRDTYTSVAWRAGGWGLGHGRAGGRGALVGRMSRGARFPGASNAVARGGSVRGGGEEKESAFVPGRRSTLSLAATWACWGRRSSGGGRCVGARRQRALRGGGGGKGGS